MLSAIRRTKSLPAWLAMIAIFTVVVTLATVIVSSLVQSHRISDTSPLNAGAHLTAEAELLPPPAHVDAGLGGRSTQSPDALAAQTAQQQQAASASVAAQVASGVALAVSGGAMANAPAAASADDAASDVAVAKTDTSGDDAKNANGRHAVNHAAAARAAARRHAAEEAARTSRSLRADIARYNADRAAGFDRNQKMVPLRAAQVPSIHSLWDDIPQPISNIYRN